VFKSACSSCCGFLRSTPFYKPPKTPKVTKEVYKIKTLRAFIL
jgi:hypothetical protein